MKLNIARVSALGTIGLGLMSLALTGGCAAGGGDPNPSSSEAVGKSAQAVITPVSLTTGGCGAVGTFAVTSPQIISFIAANTASFTNTQFQLFLQDSKNQLHQVNTTTQEATAEMMAMLKASSKSSASNSAMADQSATTSFDNSASARQFAKEQDTTMLSGNQSSFATSQTTVHHEDSHTSNANGSATNVAFNQNSASQSADGQNGTSNSADQSFLSSAMQTVPVAGFFGGVVLIPATSSSTASGSNSNSALTNAFFNNEARAQSQGLAVQHSSFDNHAHTDNSSTDTADLSSSQGSEFSQTLSHNLDSSSGTSSKASGSSASDLNTSSSNQADQSASSKSLQSSSNSSSATTQVINDLDQFNSSSFILVVNMTATQANNVLQLFQGSNGVVTGNQSFPVVIPTCGVN